jgi:hypothetical protein
MRSWHSTPSFIHVPRDEQPALFVRIAQWLRPDGLFLATLRGCDTAAAYESDWLGALMYWGGFSPATTRRLIEAAGLTITSAAIKTADEEGRAISFLWVEARGPSKP